MILKISITPITASTQIFFFLKPKLPPFFTQCSEEYQFDDKFN